MAAHTQDYNLQGEAKLKNKQTLLLLKGIYLFHSEGAGKCDYKGHIIYIHSLLRVKGPLNNSTHAV